MIVKENRANRIKFSTSLTLKVLCLCFFSAITTPESEGLCWWKGTNGLRRPTNLCSIRWLENGWRINMDKKENKEFPAIEFKTCEVTKVRRTLFCFLPLFGMIFLRCLRRIGATAAALLLYFHFSASSFFRTIVFCTFWTSLLRITSYTTTLGIMFTRIKRKGIMLVRD